MKEKHTFNIGDSVSWIRTPSNAPRGLYRVVQALPRDAGGGVRYRIRSTMESADRAVAGMDIRLSPASRDQAAGAGAVFGPAHGGVNP